MSGSSMRRAGRARWAALLPVMLAAFVAAVLMTSGAVVDPASVISDPKLPAVCPRMVATEAGVRVYWLDHYANVPGQRYACEVLRLMRREAPPNGKMGPAEAIAHLGEGDGSFDVEPRGSEAPFLAWNWYRGAIKEVVWAPLPLAPWIPSYPPDPDILGTAALLTGSPVWSSPITDRPVYSFFTPLHVSVTRAAPSGRLALVHTLTESRWREPNGLHETSAAVWLHTSDDGGSTWGVPVCLGPGFGPSAAYLPNEGMVVARVCTLGPTFAAFAGLDIGILPGRGPTHIALVWDFPGVVLLRAKGADTAEWSPARRLFDFTEVYAVAVARDARSGLWIALTVRANDGDRNSAWFNTEDSRTPSTRIYLARSADGGQTWTEPVAVTDGRSSLWQPELIVVGERLYLAYTRVAKGEAVICLQILEAPELGPVRVRPRELKPGEIEERVAAQPEAGQYNRAPNGR